MGPDPFATADSTDAFIGRSLYANLVRLHVEDLGYSLFHRVNEG